MAKRLFLLLISNLIGIIAGNSFLSAADTVVTKAPGFEAVETVIVEQPAQEEPVTVSYETPTIPTHYTVTNVTSEIVEYPNYYDVYRTGKFIYAHDASYLFGYLPYLHENDVLTITEAGITRRYLITEIGIYRKINGLLDGSVSITKNVEREANGHDISMMTCYGTHYGNGDASHRFVIFADEF